MLSGPSRYEAKKHRIGGMPMMPTAKAAADGTWPARVDVSQWRGVAAATMPYDLETPVSLYARVAGQPGAFILESVERGEQVGRYSFVGWERLNCIRYDGARWHVVDGDRSVALEQQDLSPVRELLRLLACPLEQPPTPFASGLVGYVGYDMVRLCERLPQPPPDDVGLPWAWLWMPGVICTVDHVRSSLTVVARGNDDQDAAERLGCALGLIRAETPRPSLPIQRVSSSQLRFESNFTRAGFMRAVRRAKEYIEAGDIFQVVLSQRLSAECHISPFALYRALRRLNPSPYMFLMQLDYDVAVLGASPEMFVRLRGGVAEQRPLAGTRRRGRTEEEDARLEAELRQDPKELAEHLMLVDLARNDLGRVCAYGTVVVPTRFEVERFSHVMHLVSHVVGRLRPDQDALGLLTACLPAGTVSGAPKVRAMEIIDELEPSLRGFYAGAVGYLDTGGNMDTCIAIRSLVLKGGRAYVQAGAGIVANSQPEREYEETVNKAQALLAAIQMAIEEG